MTAVAGTVDGDGPATSDTFHFDRQGVVGFAWSEEQNGVLVAEGEAAREQRLATHHPWGGAGVHSSELVGAQGRRLCAGAKVVAVNGVPVTRWAGGLALALALALALVRGAASRL
jgi:hypothetical protein